MVRPMRMLLMAGSFALLLAILMVVPVMGVDPSPSTSPGGNAATASTPTGAVALVLATDPRFAGLSDYEVLRRRTAAEFRPYIFLDSYYRELPTRTAELSQWGSAERQPGSRLIEVTLVRDCVEPTSGPVPALDPCAWRHSWYYRVQPDGTVSLLFDEGDPDEG